MTGRRLRRVLIWSAIGLLGLMAAAAAVWRSDILQALLDPEIPYPTYDPPPPPDYGEANGWALAEARAPQAGPAAVFFVHPTTYDGGRDWNSPVREAASDRFLNDVILPNYAGPFARAGAVSAPHYREASLYTRLTIREDAREARSFAYNDVRAAFLAWLRRHPDGPIVLAGAEQGGELAERLTREVIAPDPALTRRLVGVYLIDAAVPVERLAAEVPVCDRVDQTACVVAWVAMPEDQDGQIERMLKRALTWDERGRLVEVAGRPLVCVNPILGRRTDEAAPARLHRGAANATQLEWGVRPAFLDRQVTARCENGVLRHSLPGSRSFDATGSWADRRKVHPYSLFYADIEADVQRRLTLWQAANPPAQSIEGRS